MKQCPQCQANVSDTAKFCVKCGFNIKKHEEEMAKEYFCPECGTKFSGSTFCPECGYDVSADIGEQPDEMADSSAPSGRVNPHAFNPFEYEKHSNGAYTITGLKDKAAIHYTVPQGVIAIADNAFEGCLAFSVSLPEGLLKIGSAAFKACENLLTVNLPSSLVIVGDEAFADCEILDIELPATLLRVGKDVTRNTLPEKKKQEAREAELARYAVGATVTFGTYDKDKAGDKQPIEWTVLAQEGNKALLITKYAIDRKIYYNSEYQGSWLSCELRQWLNNDFMETAFKSNEQKQIIPTKLSTKNSSDTNDKVFVLSDAEAAKYFLMNDTRRCLPTGYAKSCGTSTDSTTGRCWWWLRDTVAGKPYAYGVNMDGSISALFTLNAKIFAVRPAMWIKI